MYYKIYLVSHTFIYYLPTLTEIILPLFLLKVCVYIHFLKLKQFPNMPECKFRKITLYYKNISL